MAKGWQHFYFVSGLLEKSRFIPYGHTEARVRRLFRLAVKPKIEVETPNINSTNA